MKHKHLILALSFVILSLSSFAQRVNEHGLKMVSEIEVFNKEGNGKIMCFDYETNGRLKSIIVYEVYKGKTSFLCSYKMHNNTIIRKHTEYLASFNDCVFEVDSNRHIVRYVVTPTNPNEQDYGLRWECLYGYKYDYLMKRWYLSSDVRNEWYYDIIKRKYILNHTNNINSLKYFNGVVTRILKVSDYYDFSRNNDTNISLGYILIGSNYMFDDYYFRMTEWMEYRSEYLPKNTDIDSYEYEYANGNLVGIKEIEFGKYLKKVIKIKYLY